MIIYMPAILLAFALTCLASPVQNLPALKQPEPGSDIALPSKKNQKAEQLPGIEFDDSWDEVMQGGIMCGFYSSGSAAVFSPSDFWALGDHVFVTSPGHYKIHTNGASGEGTLVIFFHKNHLNKLTWDRGFFFHDGLRASDPPIVYTCIPKPVGVASDGH